MNKPLREYESLCTLGLPTPELVPLALRLLQRRIGGTLFSFHWVGAHLEAVDTYALEPAPDRILKVYAQEFLNRREAEVGPTFIDILRAKIPLVNFSSLGARMFNSAFFSEVFRPIGTPHALRASVIDGEHRHGMIQITRPPGMGFSERDEEVVKHAARYLAHGFELERAGRLVRGEEVDGAEEGFLLLRRDGRIEHGNELGLRLFYDATRADGIEQQAAATRTTLPVQLAAQAAIGRSTGEIVLCNRRGRFAFRPFLLNPMATGEPPRIAATVRRRGTLAARLWQESERFKFSARERQIAVLLGLGLSYEDISRRLDISRNTLVSYIRRAYDKLGIGQREQLVRALLAAPAEALPEEVPT